MIPNPVEIAGRLGIPPAFAALLLAGALTAAALVVEFLVNWFDDRNS